MLCVELRPKKQALDVRYHIRSLKQSSKIHAINTPILQIKNVRFED